MNTNQPPQVDTLYQAYDRHLNKITPDDTTNNIMNMIGNVTGDNNSTMVNIPSDLIGSGQGTATTNVATGGMQSGKQGYSDDDIAGFFIGVDTDGVAKMNFGGGSSFLKWDGASLTISGGISASSLNIPDLVTANSFHVDSSGNVWWGTNVSTGHATAPAKILNTGSATFSAVTITGGTVAGWTATPTSFSSVLGGNTTILSSGTTSFSSGPTGSPTVTITQAGAITAISGVIGGFTLGNGLMYGGIIKTAVTVTAGSTGVIMDTAGLRGYDSVLGQTFNLPTDGSAPTFSNGIINSTIFEINTNAILRTSTTVGDGSSVSAGVLINDTGIYGCEANQTLANANIKILTDGTATLSASVKGGQTDFDTGTGYFLGLSGLDYKLSIGNANQKLIWDGSHLIIKGSFDVGNAGIINNSSYTVANLPVTPTTVGYNNPSTYSSTGNILIDSYSESNTPYPQSLRIGTGPQDSKWGQSFLNVNPIGADSVKFYLKKSGAPTGNAYARIYAHTGTFGTNGTPTGSILASSDAFDISTLSAVSPALKTFTFSGANRISLDANTYYFVVLDCGSTSTSSGNTVDIYAGGGGAAGNEAYFRYNSTWISNTTDTCFYMYGYVGGFTNSSNANSINGVYATFPATSGDLSISLSKDGGATYQSTLTKTFGASDTTETYGAGATELWNATWTGADITDSNFTVKIFQGGQQEIYKTFGFSITSSLILTGVEVSATAHYSSSTMYLDNVEVRIYYGTSILPVQAGSQVFASNGRKAGEGAGAGTGVLVFYDGNNWIASDTGSTVAS